MKPQDEANWLDSTLFLAAMTALGSMLRDLDRAQRLHLGGSRDRSSGGRLLRLQLGSSDR
jgi:hypothetical protein